MTKRLRHAFVKPRRLTISSGNVGRSARHGLTCCHAAQRPCLSPTPFGPQAGAWLAALHPGVALRRRLRLPLPLAHGGCGGDGFTGYGAERPSRTPRPFAGAGLGAGHARGFGACGPGCPAAKACEHLCAGCCSGRSTSLRCLIDGLPGRGAEDCARGTRSYHGTCRGKAGASKRISKQDLVSGCCCSRVAPSCQYLLRMLASGGHTPFSSSASVSDALAL